MGSNKTRQAGISIIILTHNGAHHLECFFSTFFKHNSYHLIEFIVIDHASTDSTTDVIAKYGSTAFIMHERRDRNHTFAASNNFAAQKAVYPNLLFINNDIIYTADALPTAMKRLADPRVGAVGIRLDDDPASLPKGNKPAVQHTGITFEWDSKKEFYRPVQIRHKTLAEAKSAKSGFFPAVTGAFLLCRKADFEAVGGFCEEYNCGFEDIDFCLQLGTRLAKQCYCLNDLSLQYVESGARKKVKPEIKNKRRANNDSVFKRRMGDVVDDLMRGPLNGKNEPLMPVLQQKTAELFDHKIAVICHVNYLDYWKQIAEKIRNIPLKYHVFATITDVNSSAASKAMLKEFPEATIRVFPDRGRDVAPFIKLLPEIIAKGYEIVCKIHTKKDCLEHGDAWRQLMLNCTLGTRDLVTSILNRFAGDPYLGMVGPSLLYKSNKALMYGNKENIHKIWRMMDSEHVLPEDWGFFAGSCFWARTEPLRNLAEVVNKLKFEDDHTQVDGQLAHAVERLFGLSVINAGYAFGLIEYEPERSSGKIFSRIVPPGKPLTESVIRTLSKYSVNPFKKYVNAPQTPIKHIPGMCALRHGAPTILVCSHKANKNLYGGELSFLDHTSLLSPTHG